MLGESLETGGFSYRQFSPNVFGSLYHVRHEAGSNRRTFRFVVVDSVGEARLLSVHFRIQTVGFGHYLIIVDVLPVCGY